MRNPQGYSILVDPDAATVEADTFTCSHCNRIVTVKPLAPPSDMGGWCSVCAQLICDRCVGKGCLPWEKNMERQEARGRALRSYGL